MDWSSHLSCLHNLLPSLVGILDVLAHVAGTHRAFRLKLTAFLSLHVLLEIVWWHSGQVVSISPLHQEISTQITHIAIALIASGPHLV